MEPVIILLAQGWKSIGHPIVEMIKDAMNISCCQWNSKGGRTDSFSACKHVM
jgi:hypothetical protein